MSKVSMCDGPPHWCRKMICLAFVLGLTASALSRFGKVKPANPAAPAVKRLRRVSRVVARKSGQPRFISSSSHSGQDALDGRDEFPALAHDPMNEGTKPIDLFEHEDIILRGHSPLIT